MKKENILPIICFLGFLYFVFTSFFGSNGILAKRELEKYIPLMQENIKKLSRQNRKIVEEINALEKNPNKMELEARNFSYFAKDVNIIEFKNYKPEDKFQDNTFLFRDYLKDKIKSGVFSNYKVGDMLYLLVIIAVFALGTLVLFLNMDINVLFRKYRQKAHKNQNIKTRAEKSNKSFKLNEKAEEDFVMRNFEKEYAEKRNEEIKTK